MIKINKINLYFYLQPLITFFNSTLLYSGLPSIYIIYCVFLVALKKTKLSRIITSVCYILNVTAIKLSSTLTYSMTNTHGISETIYFILYLNFPSIDIKKPRKILKIVSLFFVANSVAGLLGFGRTTYGSNLISDVEAGGSGIKGFFYSGNELSIVILILLCAWLKLKKLSNREVFLFSLLLGSLISVGTKTSALGSLIILTIMVFRIHNRLLLAAIVAASIPVIIKVTNEIYERVAFFMDIKGLQYVVFSGRFERYIHFIDEINGSSLILGLNNISPYINYENDLINLVANLGMMGLVSVFLFIYVQTKQERSSLVLFFIISSSIMSGHVLFYGAPMMMLILYNSINKVGG